MCECFGSVSSSVLPEALIVLFVPQDPVDEDFSPVETDVDNETVLVPAYVEDGPFADLIRMVVALADIGEVSPVRMLGLAMPRQEGRFGVGMFGPKFREFRILRNNTH
jgi:hypothetical protein